MKRVAIFLTLVVGLALPARAHAQWGADAQDRLNPYEYQDVDDGQFLKFVSYVLTPVGMGLEWGFMRPLHYMATQTPLAPVLSGDKGYYQFGQNNNADFVPPETFGPPPVNFSNYFTPALPEHLVTTNIVEEAVPSSSAPARQSTVH
jgi:hypothetical protein